MRHVFTWRALAGAATLLAGASATAAFAAPAGAAPLRPAQTVYVSPHAAAGAYDRGCRSAAYSSIQSAVSAVAPGGTVVVCGGTYHEDVTVSKPLSLTGEGHAVIDAAGKINGVLIKAPGARVTGFTVKDAIGEGILVASVNYVAIEHNVVTNNDLGARPVKPVPNTYPECQAQGGVPGDCGEGIHLMGSSFSTVAGNVSTGNSGGILLTDETGPTSHNRITGNVVTGNLYDCGVTLAGHNPAAAPKGVPAPKTAGIYENVIGWNAISGNGLKGEGAGVVMATPLPGGAVYDNVVEGNAISKNGMAGVSVHSHVPGQFLNGNVVTGNVITVNNLVGDKDFAPHVDLKTTGVVVATVTRLAISVAGNKIVNDHFGIWTTGPVAVAHANSNIFRGVAVPLGHG